MAEADVLFLVLMAVETAVGNLSNSIKQLVFQYKKMALAGLFLFD